MRAERRSGTQCGEEAAVVGYRNPYPPLRRAHDCRERPANTASEITPGHRRSFTSSLSSSLSRLRIGLPQPVRKSFATSVFFFVYTGVRCRRVVIMWVIVGVSATTAAVVTSEGSIEMFKSARSIRSCSRARPTTTPYSL